MDQQINELTKSDLIEICRFRSLETHELKERLKEAEEVIGFYGDKRNWFNGGFDGNFNHLDNDGSKVAAKDPRTIGGKKAREYMSKYKDKK